MPNIDSSLTGFSRTLPESSANKSLEDATRITTTSFHDGAGNTLGEQVVIEGIIHLIQANCTSFFQISKALEGALMPSYTLWDPSLSKH